MFAPMMFMLSAVLLSGAEASRFSSTYGRATSVVNDSSESKSSRSFSSNSGLAGIGLLQSGRSQSNGSLFASLLDTESLSSDLRVPGSEASLSVVIKAPADLQCMRVFNLTDMAKLDIPLTHGEAFSASESVAERSFDSDGECCVSQVNKRLRFNPDKKNYDMRVKCRVFDKMVGRGPLSKLSTARFY